MAAAVIVISRAACNKLRTAHFGRQAGDQQRTRRPLRERRTRQGRCRLSL